MKVKLMKKTKIFKLKILNHETETFLVEATSRNAAELIAWHAPSDRRIGNSFETVKALAKEAHPVEIEDWKDFIIKE